MTLGELVENITIQSNVKIDLMFSDGQSETVFNEETDDLTYADIDDKYLNLKVLYVYANQDGELVIELDSEN